MRKPSVPKHVKQAVAAAQAKKAADLILLDMREAASFTDYFLLCTAYSRPQSQAIAAEVEKRLEAAGRKAAGREGFQQGEWMLLDYLDVVVHVFSEKARTFYDLERLWRTAIRIPVAEKKARTKGK